MSFTDLLKHLDYGLYRQYRLGNLRDEIEHQTSDLNRKSENEEPKKIDYPNLDRFELMSVLNLPYDHEAVQYLRKRKIPKLKWEFIFFAESFRDIAAAYSDSTDTPNRRCLVFPFRKRNGDIFGFQARYLTGKFRYQSVMIDKSIPKVIGLDKIDLAKRVNVFEGFFDSCFVSNSIAVLDSSLHQRVDQIEELPNNLVNLWYDNEPFNEQIMKMKKKAIDNDFSVVFYPKQFAMYGKDLNDFVQKADYDVRKKIISQIKINHGMKAQLRHIEEKKGR